MNKLPAHENLVLYFGRKPAREPNGTVWKRAGGETDQLPRGELRYGGDRYLAFGPGNRRLHFIEALRRHLYVIRQQHTPKMLIRGSMRISRSTPSRTRRSFSTGSKPGGIQNRHLWVWIQLCVWEKEYGYGSRNRKQKNQPDLKTNTMKKRKKKFNPAQIYV